MAIKYNLHHFYNYEPDNQCSISGLAVNDDLKKLAVLRKSITTDLDEFQSTTIEIWNYEFINDSFFVEQRIYDDYKQPQLAESIDWGKGDRLFTVGLNEKLNEISLSRGCIKKSYQIVSGPAYCMKFNKSRELVAIGTDHGYICVFNICENSRNEVALVKNLKITSKVFSLDWYEKANETLIVASTSEQIRIFNYTTGMQKDVIYFDAKDCHIWSVRVLPNLDEFVIISGDSTGCVSFHDGSTCTQISSLNLHKNDVNAICCKNEKRAFSLGIDGRLCKFSYLNGRVIVQGNQQYISDYELKSIASSDLANCLFIGGCDSELRKADPASQSVRRFQQDFQRFISTYDRYVMYQYEKSLKVWKLDIDDESGEQQPIYLGTIVSKKEIIASTINKKFIVFSDYHKITVLSRKDDKFVKFGTILNSQLGFNLQNLILLKNTLYVQTPRSVHQFDLSRFKNSKSDGQSEVGRIKFKHRIFKTSISRNYVTIIFEDNLVEFYDLDLKVNLASLETRSLPLIVEWQSDSIVWLITNNNLYIIYDVINKKILRSDELKELLGKESNWKGIVEGISFTPHSTVVYTKSRIYSINNETGEINVNQTYKNTLKLGKLNENEFYLIELPFENAIKHLPSKVFRKKFGLN